MRTWILALSLCMLPTAAQANTRMGFINMQRAMASVSEGKKAQKVLLRKKKRYETILKHLRKRVMRQQKRFKTKAIRQQDDDEGYVSS